MKKSFFVGAALSLASASIFAGGAFADAPCPVTVTPAGGDPLNYDILSDAIDAAGDGDEVKLLGACAVSAPVKVSHAITLDGDGNTISFDATGLGDYSFSLLNLMAGSEGSTIKNTIFNYKTDGRDNAIIFISGGFAGSAEKVTTISGNTFSGSGDQAAGIISECSLGINHLDISYNEFTNLKYGMYFNSINDSSIAGNLIEDIQYNAINIAGDQDIVSSENIDILSNRMLNIATANYPDITYASGVNIGANADHIIIKGNAIVMAEGENDTIDIKISDVHADIDLADNGDYADLTELAAAVEEARGYDLDKYESEGAALVEELLDEAAYFLDGVAVHYYDEQAAVSDLAAAILEALDALVELPGAPDSGVIKSTTSAIALAIAAVFSAVIISLGKKLLARKED